MVYFVAEINANTKKPRAVKIGYVHNPTRLNTRIASLRTGNSDQLKLLAVAPQLGMTGEAAIHEVLRTNPNQHLRGEWFKPTQAVLRLIRLIKAKKIINVKDVYAWARAYYQAQDYYKTAASRTNRLLPSKAEIEALAQGRQKKHRVLEGLTSTADSARFL